MTEWCWMETKALSSFPFTFWPFKTWTDSQTQVYTSIHSGLSFMLMGQWLSAPTHLSLAISLSLGSFPVSETSYRSSSHGHFTLFMCVCGLFRYICVYACSFLGVCVCAHHCGDISIGRPILLSLRVDFKGGEISPGFSRLVNSWAQSLEWFWLGCVCVHASV